MRYLFGFLFLGLLSLNTVANAYTPRQYSGIYMGLMAGVNKTEGKSGPRSPVFKNEETTDEDNGFHADIALGFKMADVRVAAEASISTKADLADYQFENKMFSLQGYYELPMSRRVMPFVNLGIGYYSGTIKADPGISSSISGIAWNVGGGLTFALNRRISMDLGYRYVDMGTKKFKDSENQGVEFEGIQHLIYLGWRYVF